MEYIKPAFSSNNIPMVIACDNNYVPYTSVLLTSLRNNVSDEFNYDVLLFQKDITKDNQEKLIQCLGNKKNISLRFIDISGQIQNFQLRTFSYYSVEIYFRLFAPWVLKNFDKILYFDCDLVFNEDIAKLFNIDIKNNFLGVVRDVGMILHKNYKLSGIPKTYYSEFLQDIEINNYFNSGVLVMNLKKFRDELNLNDIMELIQSKKWLFPDQDVLNVLCAKKCFMLPMNWNTIPENTGDRNIGNLEKYVPKKYVDEYKKSRKNPFVIHYAMREKPWKYSINLDYSLGKYFWKYAFLSPMIFEVLKIKSKTCSMAELYKIIELNGQEKFSIQEYKDNFGYFFKGQNITYFSKKIIKFETFDVDKDNIYIRGWFPISKFEKKINNVFLISDDLTIKCEMFNKNVNEYFQENEIIGENFVFKATIPLELIKEKQIFRLFFEVEKKLVIDDVYNFGRFFPTDRIFKEQYYFKNNLMLKVNSKHLIIEPATKKQARNQEKLFIKELKKDKKSDHNRAILFRKLYKTFKPMIKKSVWLISDNFIADDNGFALFEYFVNNKPKNIKVFFAISKTNERYNELKKKLGKKLLTFNTFRYRFWSMMADVKLSSIVDFYFLRPFKMLEHDGRDIYHEQKFIFLQHGVTSNDMSREHNKFVYNPRAIITVAKEEQKEFQSDKYFYNKEDILLTGFPRFDKLYNDDKKYITIMPTWRKYILFKGNKKIKISDNEFKKSEYFKFYNQLLSNKKLIKCADKNGYKICFMQHPLFFDYNHCFESKNQKFIFLNMKHRDVFAKSSLIVSDYSSIIFDFLYLRKPIIYTHFDSKEFYSGCHAWDRGFIDHEKDGFGECEFNLNSTVERLCEYMENNTKMKKTYLDKVNNFFEYSDNQNSKRVYESIKDLLKNDEFKVELNKDKKTNSKKTLKYYYKRFRQIKKQYGSKVAFDWTKAHFERLKKENKNK